LLVHLSGGDLLIDRACRVSDHYAHYRFERNARSCSQLCDRPALFESVSKLVGVEADLAGRHDELFARELAERTAHGFRRTPFSGTRAVGATGVDSPPRGPGQVYDPDKSETAYQEADNVVVPVEQHPGQGEAAGDENPPQ
jgi:hypothetical protein